MRINFNKSFKCAALGRYRNNKRGAIGTGRFVGRRDIKVLILRHSFNPEHSCCFSPEIFIEYMCMYFLLSVSIFVFKHNERTFKIRHALVTSATLNVNVEGLTAIFFLHLLGDCP